VSASAGRDARKPQELQEPERQAEPPHPWQRLATRVIHETPWLKLREDQVRTHAGAELTMTYTDKPGAVFVVPLLPTGEVVLIRQYRYMVDEWCWEVPSGGAEGRDPALAAAAELREEIGGVAGALVQIGAFYFLVGGSNQHATAFLAREVVLGAVEHEPGELLYPVVMPFATALALARAGEITDGPSALALLLAEGHVTSDMR